MGERSTAPVGRARLSAITRLSELLEVHLHPVSRSVPGVGPLVAALSLLSLLFAGACAGSQSPGCAAEPGAASEPLAAHAAAGAPAAATPVDGDAAAHQGFDAQLSGYEYPYPVAVRRFQAQGQELEMAYMDVAPSGGVQADTQTVLLLHGKNFSGAYWADTIAALSQRGYRVVAPDQIGFGKSSKPRAFQFTFQALATHTAALLDELGVERAAVVGHSMGGMVATRFALMFPQRSAKLVLVNPIGLEDWKRVVPYQPVDAWYANELKKTPEGIKQYMTKSYFDGVWKPEYEPLLAIQAGWAQGPDKDITSWVSALTYDMIFTQPVLYEFGELRMPVLLIMGQRDRTALGKNMVPAEVAATMGRYDELDERTRDAIPNAELVELEGIGHIPQFESFDAYIAALTDFLGR